MSVMFAGLLTFINGYDVKETSKMQNVIMFAKILALVMIIIAGLTWLFLGKLISTYQWLIWFLFFFYFLSITGHTENYTEPFKDTTTDPGRIAVAFYAGIFSYSGWNYLNFMTEELKNPYV